MVPSSTSHSHPLSRPRPRRAPSGRVLSPTATSSGEPARPLPPSARSPPPPRAGHGGSTGSNPGHGGSGPSHGGSDASGPGHGACDDFLPTRLQVLRLVFDCRYQGALSGPWTLAGDEQPPDLHLRPSRLVATQALRRCDSVHPTQPRRVCPSLRQRRHGRLRLHVTVCCPLASTACA